MCVPYFWINLEDKNNFYVSRNDTEAEAKTSFFDLAAIDSETLGNEKQN